MKPTDLRIGNIVSAGTVTRIQENSARVLSTDGKQSFIHYEALEPLLLTEEWVIKFGFSVFQDSEEDDISYIKEGISWYLNLELQPTDSGFIIADYYIKYVHQLQNLYHSLTGNELKIKS